MLPRLNRIAPCRTAAVVPPGIVTGVARHVLGFAILSLGLGIGGTAELPRPQLHILNGSKRHIEMVWLKSDTQPEEAPNDATVRQTREIAGWKVHISRELLAQEPKATARTLELLQKQLEEIVRVAPPPAVAELQKVPLYVSPEYPGVKPRAEFHPGAGWLRDNGRDPAMVKSVEFTNIRIFEREMNRMPNFALHELAHAYHDRVLPRGFGNPEIKAAYEKAKASGKYERVERWNGNGQPNTFERAYAMTNPQEYFAENTEAFFSRNDYFPFTRDELKQHDAEMFTLLEKLWNRCVQGRETPK